MFIVLSADRVDGSQIVPVVSVNHNWANLLIRPRFSVWSVSGCHELVFRTSYPLHNEGCHTFTCRIFSRKPAEELHVFLSCKWLSVLYVINPKYNVCHLTGASIHSSKPSEIFGIKFERLATYLPPIRLAGLGTGYLQRNGRGQEHLSKCQYIFYWVKWRWTV